MNILRCNQNSSENFSRPCDANPELRSVICNLKKCCLHIFTGQFCLLDFKYNFVGRF